MNLWFRLIALFFRSFRAEPFTRTNDVSILRGRVWPNDLDTSLHMNNGRYLTLLDHGRTDWLIRARLLGPVLSRGWVPVVTTAGVRFIRELRFWTRYRLETRIVGWTETQVFFEHRMYAETGRRAGSLAFLAILKAGLYDRSARGFVPIDDLFGISGLEGDQPALRGDITALLDLEREMNTLGKAPSASDQMEIKNDPNS
ncbi:MAG: acyl-CoA thioesterase [Pseudomonadota bacterium]